MNDELSYGLEDSHKELLEIMSFIHEFCERHSIKYSLTGGSLLGAIRHNGFIPWDDDFDIMFDRDSYDKFILSMMAEESTECILEQDQWVYRVRKHHKTRGYTPSIDLFVLDEVPLNRITNKLQILRLRILQGMLRTNELERTYSMFYTFCIRITSFVGKWFDKEKLFREYDRISRIGNARGKGSNKFSIFDDRFALLGLQYSNELMDGYELHGFMDKKFWIIKNYKEYLVKQYGDYMQLPPVSERRPMHSM